MNTHSHYLGGRRALVRLPSGIKMIVDTDDMSITPHILIDGVWAPQIDAVLARKVKLGDKCVDIGCHYGYTALMMAALSAESVFCVDMNKDLTYLCKQNLEINGFKNRVEHFALAAVDELDVRYLRYVDNPAESGGNHLTSTDQEVDEETRIVGAVTVKEFVAMLGSYALDFVKIDTEGMDWYIFDKLTSVAHVKKCLLEHRPIDAQSHAGSKYVDKDWRDCAQLAFVTHDVHVIDAKGILHKIDSVEMLLEEEGVTHMDLYLESKV